MRTWHHGPNQDCNAANEIDGNSGDPIWPEGSSGGWVDPKYDDAGNMIYGPRPGDETSTTEDLVMVYDAWNRLAAVYTDDGTSDGEKDDDDTLIAEYRYDGRHRRIAKIEPDAAHSGKYVRTDYYYSLGWQVVEERRDDDLASKDTVASTLKYQYVWGVRYIDAPICRDEDTSGDGDCIDAKTDTDPAQNTGDEHLYYCQDANFNVTALVDDYDGAVVERYMYSPYGQPEVLHGVRDSSGTDTSADEWSARTSNTFENALLYCGYRFDTETGLYHVRRRYYHPPLGRWTSRDPIGYSRTLSLYLYVGARPLSATDPRGLQPWREPSLTEQAREQYYAGMAGRPGPWDAPPPPAEQRSEIRRTSFGLNFAVEGEHTVYKGIIWGPVWGEVKVYFGLKKYDCCNRRADPPRVEVWGQAKIGVGAKVGVGATVDVGAVVSAFVNSSGEAGGAVELTGGSSAISISAGVGQIADCPEKGFSGTVILEAQAQAGVGRGVQIKGTVQILPTFELGGIETRYTSGVWGADASGEAKGTIYYDGRWGDKSEFKIAG